MRRSALPVKSAGHRHRRGTLYVGVLTTATLVGIIGLAGLSVAHLNVRQARNTRDAETAAMLARAAVEEGVRNLVNTPTWRTSLTNNVDDPSTPVSMNGGTMTWRYVDLDGNFNNNAADGVRVYGIGRCNGAVYVESVLLQPNDAGLTCLEAPFHCNGDITLQSTVTMTTQQFISSNGSINATALTSRISGSAEAVGSITGTVSGGKKTGITPRQMPGNTVFDYYLANGTWIDINTLPLSSGNRLINRQVMSPTLHPYTAAGNAEGIYVLDCQGQNLMIQDLRLLGTLVILNPGTTCCIRYSQAWCPISPNYPVLMVQGSVQFIHGTTALSETTTGTNYNPPGAPDAGVTDHDQADQYPCVIKGLVYVSGQIRFPLNLAESGFDGSVVCSTVLFDAIGNSRFSYRPTHLHYPPPGFATGSTMQIVPGTWKRSALP